ncbi:sulfotransferase [Myceligenerans crystallogenes]|uniref:Sulfotransferase n=1 Tax=Myceligenerans crystallogenes TaxID=316335 RepID=A0ABN2NHU4_9MICO
MTRTTRVSRVLNTVFAPVVRGNRNPEGAWAKAAAAVEAEAGTSDPEFAAGLGIVARSIGEEPRLTPLGWFFALASIKDRYANRLRIKRLLREHPQIADEQITAPVFVLGLPRTATTLTHRVLAASADHRGPMLWEMTRTDLENPAAARSEIRKLDVGTRLIMNLFSPGLLHMHPTSAEKPEESLLLLPHGTFWPLLYGAMPAYRQWYAGRSRQELFEDYLCLKQGLQVLQHGRVPRRWVLKYPGHVADMTTIREVFPDATFVWTHRDPASVVGSTCSLLETVWSQYQKDPDPLEIGAFVLETMATWVERGLDARLDLPPSAIVDVPYHTLAADPHTQVPRLYAAIGATWTPEDEARLGEVVAKPAGTRPHRYDIARYGLRPEQIEEVFAPYLRLLPGIDVLDAEPTAEL